MSSCSQSLSLPTHPPNHPSSKNKKTPTHPSSCYKKLLFSPTSLLFSRQRMVVVSFLIPSSHGSIFFSTLEVFPQTLPFFFFLFGPTVTIITCPRPHLFLFIFFPRHTCPQRLHSLVYDDLYPHPYLVLSFLKHVSSTSTFFFFFIQLRMCPHSYLFSP